MSYGQTFGNGVNWQVEQWPFLVFNFDGSIVVLGRGASGIWFEKSDNDYVPTFSVTKRTLEHDSDNGVYRLSDVDGSVVEFDDFTGMLQRQIDPAGNVIEVQALSGNGFNFTQVERTFAAAGHTTTEQLAYEYSASSGDYLLGRVTLRRKVDSGTWTNVSRANYTYYEYGEAHGGEEDLKTVTTQTWQNGAWVDTGTTYYRYYAFENSSSSTSSTSGSPGLPAHLLKYVVNPAAYARLADDPNVTDPLTASDAIVAQYADLYFEYDSLRRVTKEMVHGGSQTFLFEYEEFGNLPEYNSWNYKTTETLPDGNQNVIYSNYAGLPMLHVFKSGADEWCHFYKYDDDGNVVFHAAPSAITGYDEEEADLLKYYPGLGKYEYLRDEAGLIRTYTFAAGTHYMTSSSLQEGQLGTSIKLYEWEYVACGDVSSSSSSSSGAATSGTPRFLSKETIYPSDTDQNKTIVTTYDYTFHSGTCQIAQKTTMLPAVPTEQNGSGVSATRKEYFDTYGNRTWQMDERGYITRFKYDIPTGAVIQRIDDVDTSIETDAPDGWTTPSGGGLNLVTDFEHDDRGRLVQSLGPSHTIDIAGVATTIRRATWMVYVEGEEIDETWTAQGFATGTSPNYTYTLVNPVSITKSDKNGKPLEAIKATRASSSGKLSPTDSFPQSSYVRWTTYQYTDCCIVASMRAYHTIPATGEGASGTNYDETVYGYDTMKRRNRTVTPGGTITDLVYDARGFVIETYVGTDDSGATESDPTGGVSGPALGNNMVLVTENEYDGGNDGGDGNLTAQTQHVDDTTARVTSFAFDWRNRRTDVDGEIDFYQKDHFDNLDRVVRTERYHTTSGGNLVSRGETKYDDRGRVFRTVRYGVDPSTGTVGNSLTDNTWYDASGNVIKTLPAGAELFTKFTYESLGRRTRQYVGFGTNSTYANVFTVADDVILEQMETEYDAAGNVVQSTDRKRYHNAAIGQTGALQDPSTTPKARVSYVAAYPDPLGRTVATANYGTNGGTALSRSSTVPARSDTVLVTRTDYDSAGNVGQTSDPSGMITRFEHDHLSRQTAQILNYQGVSSSSSSSSSSGDCPACDDVNVTVRTAYNADGNVASITAVNAATGDQVTQYVYGTTLDDSEIASSLLKRAEVFPDSVDSDDRIKFTYNRQQQITSVTDQNGTVHSYDYDLLGRQTQDRITTVGTGVDDAVLRIEAAYEVRGMRETLTNYDDAAVGQGNVVNDVLFTYNDFGQLTADYQSHSGAVNTMSTPKVEYGYADGSDDTIRQTSLTYPNGRVIRYEYGTAGSIDDKASRIASIVDDDMAATHLADYSYLGVGSRAENLDRPFGTGIVEVDYTEPDVKYTLIDLAGSNDLDTGDIYSGFDRFGRVKDCRWYDYGSSQDVDRFKYGYDRSGNRVWRQNVVANALGKHFDELYAHDAVHRLQHMDRGTLATLKDAVTDRQFAQCWSLDSIGNWDGFREDEDGDGNWDLVQSRAANKVNEITEIIESVGTSWVIPAYNPAGNMTTIPQPSDPTQSYTATYDAWNRLVKLIDTASIDAVAEYEYDATKRRSIGKSYTGGVLSEIRHLYYTKPNRWQIVEERVGTSSDAERQFVWGTRYIDDLALRDRDTDADGTTDERLYASQDVGWNVTGIVDNSGEMQEHFAYGAYGLTTFLSSTYLRRATSEHDWEIHFAGYHYSTDVFLTYSRHRVLHPLLGAWIQRDPLGIQASANLYQYCDAHPIDTTDPTGLGLCDISTHPFTSCFCALIQFLDTALSGVNAVIPVPGPVATIGALLSIGDCACDIVSTIAAECICGKNPGIGDFVGAVASGASCVLDAIDVLDHFLPSFQSPLTPQAQAFWEWITYFVSETAPDVDPGPNTGFVASCLDAIL